MKTRQRPRHNSSHGRRSTRTRLHFTRHRNSRRQNGNTRNLRTSRITRSRSRRRTGQSRRRSRRHLLNLRQRTMRQMFRRINIDIFINRLNRAGHIRFTIIRTRHRINFLTTVGNSRIFVTNPPRRTINQRTLFTNFQIRMRPVNTIRATRPRFQNLQLVNSRTSNISFFRQRIHSQRRRFSSLNFIPTQQVTTRRRFRIIVISIISPLSHLTGGNFSINKILTSQYRRNFNNSLLYTFSNGTITRNQTFSLNFFTNMALNRSRAMVGDLVTLNPAYQPNSLTITVSTIRHGTMVVQGRTFIRTRVITTRQQRRRLSLSQILNTNSRLSLNISIPRIIHNIFNRKSTRRRGLVNHG